MKPADEQLAEALAAYHHWPAGRCRSGRTSTPNRTSNPARFATLLVRQVLSPVRWEETMRGLLAEGVERFYEIGPGRVLAGLTEAGQSESGHPKHQCLTGEIAESEPHNSNKD